MTNNTDGATLSQPSQNGARLATLRRYLTALDRGDAVTVAAILRAAQTDAALERLVLTANSAYLDQEHPELIPLAERETTSPDGQALWTAASELEAPVPSTTAMPRPVVHPRPVVLRWASVLAAALAVSLLLASFFALFTGHGAPGSSGSSSATVTTPAESFLLAGTQDGYVIALRTDTGAVVWRWGGHQTIDELVRSADVVYVTSHPAIPLNSNATTLLTALRVTDGSQLWQTTEPQLQDYTYMALDSDVLVVTSDEALYGTIYGLDARSGLLQWTNTNTANADLLITATGGIAYLDGLSLGFTALNDRTGKTLWTYDQGNTPAITSGNGPTILAGSGGLVYYYLFDLVKQYPPNTPSIVTFDAATGAVRETLTLGQTGLPRWVTPDGTAYTTKNNQLCALHIAGAVPLWCALSIDAGTPFSLLLARTSNVLCYSRIINSDSGGSPVEVGALDNATGRPLWTWQGPASLYSASNSMSLVCGQGAVYLATRHGLYVFEPTTGHLLWHVLPTTDLSFIEPVLAP